MNSHSLLLVLLGLGALAEVVLEAASQVAHVGHATGALGAAALGLVVLVESAHLCRSTISAGSAACLLDVEGRLSAPPADGVRLVVTRACASDTFRHGARRGVELAKRTDR